MQRLPQGSHGSEPKYLGDGSGPEPEVYFDEGGGGDFDLATIARALRRRWKIVAGCLLVSLALGLGASFLVTPTYTASATIEIKEDTPAVELGPRAPTGGGRDRDQTPTELIQSRSLARRVIEEEKLLEHPAFAASMARRGLVSMIITLVGLGGDERPEEPRRPPIEAAITHFLRRLSVEPVRATQLLVISWNSTDPELAARVTNATARTYRVLNLEKKSETAEEVNRYLESAITSLETNLAEDEARLAGGTDENSMSPSDRRESAVEVLTQLNEQLTSAMADRLQTESAYRQLQGATPATLPAVMLDGRVAELRASYEDSRRQYSELSRRFTDEYTEVKEVLGQIADLEATIAQEEQIVFTRLLADARREHEAAVQQEENLRSLVRRQESLITLLDRAVEADQSLQIRVDTGREMLDTLLTLQMETGVNMRMQGMSTSNIGMVDQATPPSSPTSPNTAVYLLISTMVGLMSGAGLAFLKASRDRTLQSPADVWRQLGVASLALVPSLSLQPAGGGVRRYLPGYRRHDRLTPGNEYAAHVAPAPISQQDAETLAELGSIKLPGSSYADAYRLLRMRVLSSTRGSTPKVMLVTSAKPEEGKTTAAVNLAVSLASVGKKVLLLDFDMRRPRLHRLLRLDNGRGLVHVLHGKQSIEDAIQPTEVDNLWAVPCGPRPPVPSELLTSTRVERLLSTVRERFDFIILDTPPVNSVVDPLMLAPLTDGVVLVVKGGETPYPAVERACEQLDDVGGELLGLLLNSVHGAQWPTYSY